MSKKTKAVIGTILLFGGALGLLSHVMFPEATWWWHYAAGVGFFAGLIGFIAAAKWCAEILNDSTQ